MRTAKHADVEDALLLWFKNARAMNVPLSGPILQAKVFSSLDTLESFSRERKINGSQQTRITQFMMDDL